MFFFCHLGTCVLVADAAWVLHQDMNASQGDNFRLHGVGFATGHATRTPLQCASKVSWWACGADSPQFAICRRWSKNLMRARSPFDHDGNGIGHRTEPRLTFTPRCFGSSRSTDSRWRHSVT
jgi:hypothetical protein